MFKIILILLVSIGCQSDFKRISLGIGSTTPLERNVQKHGQSLAYTESSIKHGYTLDHFANFPLDILIGPRIGIALTRQERGAILGGEIEGRIRYQNGNSLQPYVGLHAGKAYFTKRWLDQGTNWGFTLGAFFGLKYNNLTIEYRFWHESNGTKVFGHNYEPNPGYNVSMLVIGIEW